MRVPPAPLLLLLLLASGCSAFNDNNEDSSPLKGYGTPGPNTTEIYVSAYLDRLLNVNDKAYQFESIMYFYLSWTDPEARVLMEETTLRMRNPNDSYTCTQPCSSHATNTRCCDGIYLPGFYFKNAYGYSGISYDTYFPGPTSVLREVRVQGTYYQAMNFGSFPFDSFDLLTELRFKDTTRDINVSSYGFDSMRPVHERMRIIPSSGSKKLFNLGAGDDANDWQVVNMCLSTYNLSMFDGTKEADRYSAIGDPVPLWPNLDALLAGGGGGFAAVGAPANRLLREADPIVAIYLTVKRFGRSGWMDGILPVLVVYLLGLFVFVLDFEDEAHLYNRLQLVVTLFLSLTAVQFVLVDKVPTSSYMTPMQQLVLATYVFLCCVSLESILLHCYVAASKKFIWTALSATVLLPYWLISQAVRLIHRQGRALMRRPDPAPLQGQLDKASSAGSAASSVLGSEASPKQSEHLKVDGGECGSRNGRERQPIQRLFSPARLHHRYLRWSSSLGEVCICESGACPCKDGPCPCKEGNCPCTSHSCDCRLGRCPCRTKRQGRIQRKRMANLADNAVFTVLALGYALAAILIFTLQAGYTSLFPVTDDRGATACPHVQ
ncbi:hypothetical protein D9Q98_008139 [Chlorella vulgaris]|uniref:Uncharacterized protein n=1 Tax=Chlorella vulgaris TaxID=3077 RepID=A0A9D4YT97_CHLVU|nr:hypothetical protein D9Q98_008139 [Chlorella vulgaris]